MTASERIVLTKWTPGLAVFMVAVTALLWLFPLISAFRGGYNRGEQVMLAVVSALLAVPFLWVCWRVPKVLRGMGIEVDTEGIHPFDGKRVDTIAWHEIAAVGFGAYAGTHRGGTTRRLAGLEVYLMDTARIHGHPRLSGDWQEVAPPAVGLSAGCYRFTVSPYGPAAARVEQAVRRFRPQVWRGPFLHHREDQRRIG
ncbi:hypothetical protein [Mycolicibacterium litorale]|uniref:Uncharacterized protein n=1 Tax=Mycolicibacterium litorale TaxID=758802 RepID=A0AAD1MUE7_9MYCO|nr:hypothetical protein [Mycolicibacterium litorale]TDY06445.1 hypothetical protein BCL50_2770 [Mycolicibacterium litorale]BBY19409.1 hypothetical protein MLIT_50010 [Mycolicibacterium litorale]